MVAGLYIVKGVKDKKTMARLDPITKRRSGKPCVHHLVQWTGAQWAGHDTWEPVDQLQGTQVKTLLNTCNEKLRATAQRRPPLPVRR